MTTSHPGRSGLKFGLGYLFVFSAMAIWWLAMTWSSNASGPALTVVIAFLGPILAVGSLVRWGRGRADRDSHVK